MFLYIKEEGCVLKCCNNFKKEVKSKDIIVTFKDWAFLGIGDSRFLKEFLIFFLVEVYFVDFVM